MIMDQKGDNAIVDPELGSQKDHIPTKSTINLVTESCNDISNGSKYPNSKHDVLKGWLPRIPCSFPRRSGRSWNCGGLSCEKQEFLILKL